MCVYVYVYVYVGVGVGVGVWTCVRVGLGYFNTVFDGTVCACTCSRV